MRGDIEPIRSPNAVPRLLGRNCWQIRSCWDSWWETLHSGADQSLPSGRLAGGPGGARGRRFHLSAERRVDDLDDGVIA